MSTQPLRVFRPQLGRAEKDEQIVLNFHEGGIAQLDAEARARGMQFHQYAIWKLFQPMPAAPQGAYHPGLLKK